MDKTIVGLIGAMTALAATAPAQATPTQLADVMQVTSYADLLKPVPDASRVLKASDEAQGAGGEATLQLAQYDGDYGYGYRRYHHHHHHHHHHGYGPRFYVSPYGFGYGYHHHHHHHHHHHYRRYDYGY